MRQIIQIDENSKIEVEDNNYILFYKSLGKDPKTGKPATAKNWTVGGYFPTMESLVNDWVINAPAHKSEAIRDLKGLVDCIQDAEKRITKLIKGK